MQTTVQIFGQKALERIAEAPRFNRWMYETIAPFTWGNILEIGSGIGNISSHFIAAGAQITLSDFDESYVQTLHERFRNNAKEILTLDLADSLFMQKFSGRAGVYNSIFMLNVLEHIEDDRRAVAYCRSLLSKNGRLIILVPAYPFLFSKMDRLLGHYRRYTENSLRSVLEENRLSITDSFYFNALGIAGWGWNKLRGIPEISAGKMDLYNRLVPFAKMLDKILFRKAGLSLIMVAENKALPEHAG